MPKVAVFHRPDNTVSVMRPPIPTEDAAVMVSLASAEAGKSPLTDGVPFAVLDEVTLPPREQIDAQGDRCPTRGGWRWNGTGVEIDPASIPPNYEGLVPRLRMVLPVSEWPSGLQGDLVDAIRSDDVARVAEIRTRLVAQVDVTYQTDLIATFAEKRIT